MRIFLETANLSDIRWGVAAGLVDGVATHASLIANEAGGLDYRSHLAEICRVVTGPVTADVMSVTAEEIYREGRELARIADTVIVNVPMIEEGLAATRRLTRDGVRVNTVLVFGPAQALLAAKAGATYVSPSLSPLDGIGDDGIAAVQDIRDIFDNYVLECEILTSSIRNPRQFTAAAKLGSDAVAVTPSLLRSLLLHPLTDRGLDESLNDWSRGINRSRAGG